MDSLKSAWKVLSSKELFKIRWMRLRSDEVRLPDGRVMPQYFVLEFPHWVNVVALTEDHRLVMVRQFRHAARTDSLEIPGGAGHVGEDPIFGAQRELKEETGFESSEWSLVGSHYPNPAMQNNVMVTFLATHCRKTSEASPDPFEDIEVELVDPNEVYKMVEDGRINHSIVMASLAMAKGALFKILNR